MTEVLEVSGLKTVVIVRSGQVHAVDGVSFTVDRGETLGLVGESGCGKTMTALSVMRLLPEGGSIVEGSVILDGTDLVSCSEQEMLAVRGSRIGYIFQDPMTSLNPTMTIGRQVAEPYRVHEHASREMARKRAVEILGQVGLPRPRERLDEFPHQLSGGLRQRVVIAMALVCDPVLLIADEPTTALDVTIQAQLLDLLENLQQQLGMAMVLITHDMGVIAGRTDRVAVMYAGRVVETGPTAQVFAASRHPYTEALLASIPRTGHDEARELFSIPGVPPDLKNPSSYCRFAPRCAYATEACMTTDPVLEGSAQHLAACIHSESVGSVVLHEGALKRAPRGSPPQGAVDADGTRDAIQTLEAPLLRLRDVCKEYPLGSALLSGRRGSAVHAVSDVSFDVVAGEVFGIVGESGCGKTTLGRMIAAHEMPTSGSIELHGRDLSTLRGAELRKTRRNLQMMFQDPYSSLDPRMRVGAIVEEPLRVQGMGRKAERRQRVQELLSDVGLPASAVDRYPHEFSGGQRQRIGLARALALKPKIIVADEPVSALDVSIRSQVLNVMQRLRAEHALTYLLISHDLSVVRFLADRIAVMYLGALVELSPSERMFEQPAHPYTAGLLEAIPVPEPEVERSKRSRKISGELPSAVDPPSGCRFRTRCDRATDRCAAERPLLADFGGGQLAACHFPLRPPAGLGRAGATGEAVRG